MELETSFNYKSPVIRIHSGPESIEQIKKEVDRLGAQRAFIVCGKSVAREGHLLEVIRQTLGVRYAGTFDGVQKESPLSAVEACVEAARKAEADLLISVGGGTAVVTTRATVILLGEDGNAHDLCTQYPEGKPPVSPRLLKPKIPNFIVLTTPTIAALAAGGAVYDTIQSRRLELFDPKSRPASIFLDSRALGTAPSTLYLSTAMTTLVSTIEGLMSPALNGFSRADLTEALHLSLENLPEFVRRPEDPSIRNQLAIASILRMRGADALPRAGHSLITGLFHAVLGSYNNLSQGHAACTVLAAGMRFMGATPSAGLSNLTAAFGKEDITQAATAVTDLLQDLGIPTRLRELQIPKAGLEVVADNAMRDFYFRTAQYQISKQKALELLEEAW
ncbi:iron-containing alcohol dehydrogenase family protein [Neobacillus niacini]|uniref:iron-containing alcohol dehydrogenase family protein n=1 Tax=Neobacillus niacini TaxID=86668 RepID=UPI0030003CE6